MAVLYRVNIIFYREGDDVRQDNGVFIWIWMIGVAVIFVLLL